MQESRNDVRSLLALIKKPRSLSFLVAGVFITLFPLFTGDPYVLHLMILSLIFAVVASSWDLLIGYVGVISYGHVAFFGLGAYMSALLSMKLGLSPWVSLFAGGLIAGLGAFPIGLTCIRLRGYYIALATIAYSEVLRILFFNSEEMGGSIGLWGIPSLPVTQILNVKVTFESRVPYYYVALILFSFSSYILFKITSSRMGLAFVALRESEESARSLGINPIKYKLIAFFFSSSLSGVMGGFYAHYIQLVTPDLLSMSEMIDVALMGYLGGIGTIYGPQLGSFLVIILLEIARELGAYRYLIFGLLIMLVVLRFPEGVIVRLLRNISKYVRRAHTGSKFAYVRG